MRLSKLFSLGHFPKSGNRFLDKKCGKNKKLEQISGSIKSHSALYALLAGFVLLAACSGGGGNGGGTMSKIRQILADPSLEVGKSNTQTASAATITIYAEPDANQTDYGAAPVELWIFELSDPDELMAADFMALIEDPKQTLTTSYVKHYKKQVVAGRSTVLAPFDLDERTNYIGVAAGYADIDNVKWRAVERVKPKGETYSVMVPVTKKRVQLQLHR